MEQQIQYSDNESRVLGFKVGRLIIERDFDVDAIQQEILEDQYDLVRLRVPSSNELVVLDLNRLGFPNYFSGSIRKYKTAIIDLPKGAFHFPDIVYEPYDGSQDVLLLELLRGTWGDYPLGYYKTPYLAQLVTKETELKAVCNFYRNHNLPANNPKNGIMFMKHKGNYVGFFAMNTYENHFESHIGGIIQPYRTSKYFIDMQEYIRRFCIKNSLEFFCFGARNENGRVQSIFQEFGYTPFASDNIFHITPFLSYNHNEVNQSTLNASSSLKDLRRQILDIYNQKCEANRACNMLKTNHLQNALNTDGVIELTNICKDEKAQLYIYKIFKADKQLLSWGYLECEKL